VYLEELDFRRQTSTPQSRVEPASEVFGLAPYVTRTQAGSAMDLHGTAELYRKLTYVVDARPRIEGFEFRRGADQGR
jgi:hypothetical protein